LDLANCYRDSKNEEEKGERTSGKTAIAQERSETEDNQPTSSLV